MKTTTHKTRKQVHPPPQGAADMTSDQLDRLAQLAISQECVFHPSFELPGAETELFGPDAPQVDINPWANFPGMLTGDMATSRRGSSKLRSDDEARLFLRYNYARYRLAGLGRDADQPPSGPQAQEMQRWYQRTMNLRSQITGANLALVIAMAKRTRIPDMDFPELISEGNVALLRAIEKFDVSRGFKFSTYACRVILKSFSRMASKAITHKLRFGVEFDANMEPEDNVEIKHRAIRNDALSRLHEILSMNQADLNKPERKVIDRRFALTDGGKKKTLAVVGKEMGVSKERIRQIQRSALAKLRRALRNEQMAG